MSDLPNRRDESDAPASRSDDEQASGGFTRRNVLAGAAVTTAVATIGDPASALSVSPDVQEDMILFVLLSAALTGIPEGKLSPGFGLKRRPSPVDLDKLKLSDFPLLNAGSDPVDIKRDYFIWINDRHAGLFERLLRLTRDNLNPDGRSRAEAIVEKVQAAPDDIKFLARSIVLMWYLGGRYKPDALRVASKSAAPGFLPFEVISPKAYTQGWALRVAQAHPMGFSELQFGYWSRKPPDLDFKLT